MLFRFSLALLCFSLSISAGAAAAPDISDILSTSMILTHDPLHPGTSGALMDFGLNIAGDSVAGKLQDMILAKLNTKELDPYFTAKEKAALAAAVASDVKKRFFSGAANAATDMAAIAYATNELIGRVIPEVMQKKGVTDKGRIQAWSNRLLAPFNLCVKNATTFTAVENCASFMQDDLVKNIGLAVSMETVRQQFGAAYEKIVAPAYSTCLKPASAGANDRAESCALQVIRSAVVQYGKNTLAAAALNADVSTGPQIAAKVTPAFQQCVNGASDRNGFLKCADQFMTSAGSELAGAAISGNPTLKTYFPSAVQLGAVTATAKADFLQCMGNNVKTNKRDAGGTLETANCSQQVTANAASKVLDSQVANIFGNTPPATMKAAQAKVLSDLNTCLAKPGAKANPCINALRGNAEVAIAREAVRQYAAAGSDTTTLPPEITALEAKLTDCVSKGGDPEACAKAHIVAAAKFLGSSQLTATLQPVLDAAGVWDSSQDGINGLETAFNACLDKITGPLDTKFKAQIDACGTTLLQNGGDFMAQQLALPPPAPVPAPAAAADTLAVPAAATIAPVPPAAPVAQAPDPAALPDSLARALLCMNGNIPLDPSQSDGLAAMDPSGLQGQLAKLIGSYINYDAANAKMQISAVMSKISDDLKAAGPEQSQKELMDQLAKSGMVDQLLKGVIHGQIEDSLSKLPADQQPAAALKASLLDKATLDKALTPDLMNKLRPLMSDGVLQPVIVQGKPLDSPVVALVLENVKSQVADSLLTLPDFSNDPAAQNAIKTALKN